MLFLSMFLPVFREEMRWFHGVFFLKTDIKSNSSLSLTTGAKTENRQSDVNSHQLDTGKRQSHEKQDPVLQYAHRHQQGQALHSSLSPFCGLTEWVRERAAVWSVWTVLRKTWMRTGSQSHTTHHPDYTVLFHLVTQNLLSLSGWMYMCKQ